MGADKNRRNIFLKNRFRLVLNRTECPAETQRETWNTVSSAPDLVNNLKLSSISNFRAFEKIPSQDNNPDSCVPLLSNAYYGSKITIAF
ncbi:MAG: hypothetical protein DWQ10_01770 [Calditrichaeota bacterium]|nr:MAG: hypothetical protein DWQ10_01770 [Calditrichota bacterium]